MRSCLRATFMVSLLLAMAGLYALYFVYEVKVDGELVLDRAPGEVKITREADTQILHIKGDGWPAISYGQGFACAQTRLWQLEKMRRLAKGRLSELFGKETVSMDEFFKNIGMQRSCEATWAQGVEPLLKEALEAYSNGVNDYVQGVSLSDSEQQTARAFPPEFLVFGITKESFEPWTPVDCLMMIRIINFTLTWNWASDLQREAVRQEHPDLEVLLEELMPFTSDYMYDVIPIVEDDDLKQYGLYSDESLVKRYRDAFDHVKSAEPPKNPKSKQQEMSPNLKDYIKQRDGPQGDDIPKLGQSTASNNFVVHGNHTTTGMPLFASDPHLQNGLPAHWVLYNLEFPDGRILSGAQLAGVPAIGIGRSNNITWGCTTSRVDTSDIWQEQLNEDETEYLVDGEWRKLHIIEEVLKVKGQPDRVMKIKQTHRGSIMSYGLMQTNSDLLFGGASGKMDADQKYSFAWSGQYVGDNFFSILGAIFESKDLHELYSKIDGELGEDYRGLGQNILFADTSGNIGYRLLMSVPERNDKTPFIGSRVLDGTTTKWDWTGKIIHQKEMPRALNPKKGYLVTANGRQTTDNAINDFGAQINDPGRVLRIDEILKTATESGKKLSLADLGAIQQDVTDVIARRMTPIVLKLAAEVDHHLTKEQRETIAKVHDILSGWQGTFEETSIAAPVYTRFYIQFLRSLFMKQAGADENQRLAFSDNYHFTDAYQRLLTGVQAQKEESHFQVICEGAYENYSGQNYCAYSIAMALVQAHDWLSTKYSSNPAKWLWRDLHFNEYSNLPWSKTPLKFIFHRSVGVPGNDCTPNVSKVSARKNKDNTEIRSTASANFKMLIQLAEDPKDDVSLFSIDAGMNGNLFQGNYFDMNKDHLEGKLKPMRWQPGSLDGVKTTTLTLKPAKQAQTQAAEPKESNDEL